jgi:hypothetical protein
MMGTRAARKRWVISRVASERPPGVSMVNTTAVALVRSASSITRAT